MIGCLFSYKLRPNSDKQPNPDLGTQLAPPTGLDELYRALDMRSPGRIAELLRRDILGIQLSVSYWSRPLLTKRRPKGRDRCLVQPETTPSGRP